MTNLLVSYLQECDLRESLLFPKTSLAFSLQGLNFKLFLKKYLRNFLNIGT